MDTLIEQYHQDFARHAGILEALQTHTHIDAADRAALAQAVRLLHAISAHPEASAPLVSLLASEDQERLRLRAKARAVIIWSRVDGIVRQAATDTFNLGRVSEEMIQSAQALGEASARLRGCLQPGREREEAMDEIEGVSHRLRNATKALSGSTPTAVKVDHDGLEKILVQWTAISSVEMLLERFAKLGIAWEDHPVIATSLRAVQAGC